MGTITRGTKAGGGTGFNSGQTIDPAENNTDFNTAYTEINGNLDNDNIKAAAAIVSSKITFDGARVTNSGTISLLDNTATLMTWDTETFDISAYHSTASNTGRLIAPTTGKYLVSGVIVFSGEASAIDSSREIAFRLNAAGSGSGGTLIGHQVFGVPTLTRTFALELSVMFQFTATDYVECFVAQVSGETLNANLTTTPSHFAITRLGA